MAKANDPELDVFIQGMKDGDAFTHPQYKAIIELDKRIGLTKADFKDKAALHAKVEAVALAWAQERAIGEHASANAIYGAQFGGGLTGLIGAVPGAAYGALVGVPFAVADAGKCNAESPGSGAACAEETMTYAVATGAAAGALLPAIPGAAAGGTLGLVGGMLRDIKEAHDGTDAEQLRNYLHYNRKDMHQAIDIVGEALGEFPPPEPVVSQKAQPIKQASR